MPHLGKRKRSERAHRYKVLAQQLDFHLATDMNPNVKECVEGAKHLLLEAATLLERELNEMDEVGALKLIGD